MTHRDPVQVLASILKMTLTPRGTRYETVDPKRVGRQMFDFVRRHICSISLRRKRGRSAASRPTNQEAQGNQRHAQPRRQIKEIERR